MMMMMQINVESNDLNFVRQVVVNSSMTSVYLYNLPENVNGYLLHVSAYNSVANSPQSIPVLVGQLKLLGFSCFFRPPGPAAAGRVGLYILLLGFLTFFL